MLICVIIFWAKLPIKLHEITFIVGPLIAWFIVPLWKKSFMSSENSYEASSSSLLVLSLSIFSAIVVAALIFDILTADSPYGIIHLGGAIFADGLIWAPIISSGVFLVFVIMSNILKVGIPVEMLWKNER